MDTVTVVQLAERLAGRLWRRIEAHMEAGSLTVGGAAGSLASLLVALLWQHCQRPVLLLTPTQEDGERWEQDLVQWCPKASVSLWTRQPRQLWERVRQLDVSQLRAVEIALELLARHNPILVCTPELLNVPLPRPEDLAAQCFRLYVGQEQSPEGLIQRLLHHGFQRVDAVATVGDVARRGGIVDFFPLGFEEPIRVEFWGDTVESIRCFDPETQRSTGRFEAVEVLSTLLWDHTPARLWDYLPSEALGVVDRPELIRQSFFRHCGEELKLPQAWRQVALNPLEEAQVQLGAVGQPSVGRSVERLAQELRELAEQGYELFLCAPEGASLRRFQQLVAAALRDGELSDGDSIEDGYGLAQQVQWVEGIPAHGFLWHAERVAVWTEHEVFGRLPRRTAYRRRSAGAMTLRELQQLKVGDYVVHVDHGIGIFDGFQMLTIGDRRQECIRLLYAEGDVLYVPLEYIHKLQRYEAGEGIKPKLHRLGSHEWQAVKQRAKGRLKEIARELVRLYARRKLSSGFAFPADTLWQKEMEAAFPYEDTPDQARATAEVKADMEAPIPMDRLICGDVGFGKTEVAIRAAFKAVQAGKQVAVLVPTTVLAEQHFLTFSERLRPYPVVIAVLSRFRTRQEQREILRQLASGHIDIIIGTHRLLSPDVRFHDLGLLIVDEEHRFGVIAKERLRHLRVNVDTLMLTATPIPRTLHMALIGIRDISLIETPPQNRLPVRTYVVQWDDELIRYAIEAELEREGQVFFVTTHIQGIEQLRERLQRLVPQARFGIAHGRMRARELEEVMEDFLRGRLDILVCTKIVEAGLDFPRANTIFIHHAEDFGLAELYQLRGRVGRSNVQAYCYLIVPPVEQLTSAALRRLQALEEFTELGSGFRLALRDLEIRGAGNLFGPEQSGFLAQMGFELYQQVLERAIEELKAEEFPELGQRRIPVLKALRNPGLVLDIPGEALLPDDYVPSEGERFYFYKRLYKAEHEAAVDEVVAELRDRFGELPPAAQALTDAVRLRVYLLHTGCTRVRVRPAVLSLELPARGRELFYRYAFPVFVELVHRWSGAQFVQERQRVWVEFPLADQADAFRLARLIWEELACALHGVEVEAPLELESEVEEEVP
ncbi:MAG: transcription-repair coupling factor [Chlorobiota bacterium]